MKIKNLKSYIALILVSLFLVAFCGCDDSEDQRASTTLEDLKSYENLTIGTPEADGVEAELKELFPEGDIEYYSDVVLGLNAVETGKIDAFASGRYFIERDMADTGITDLTIIDEPVKVFDCALGLSESCEIADFENRVNECINQLKEDGTLEKMKQRWFDEGCEEMPDIPEVENPEYTIHAATYGASKPFSFIKNDELVGFDVELAYRVAAYLNCAIELDMTDYNSLLLGLSEGKYDMVSANLYVSDERKESVIFSEPYNESEICLVIREDSGEAASDTEIDSLADFKTLEATIGVPSDYDIDAELYEICPGMKKAYYDDVQMGIKAVASGKITGFAAGEDYFEAADEEGTLTGTKVLEEPVKTFQIGLGLSEDTPIDNYVDKVNQCIAELKEDGTLESMQKRWLDGTDYEMPEIDLPDNPEYTLEVVTYGMARPYSFVKNNELVGYDVELAYRVAAYLGCGLNLSRAEYPSMLLGLASGKYDMISASLYIEEERAENINYSDPYGQLDILMLVKDDSDDGVIAALWDDLKSGLKRTFIDEDRWQMILSGLGTTLLITFLGFILANIMGGIFCCCSLSEHRLLRGVEEVYTRIMQGTPMVVVLMILFYIVFGSSKVSGVWIAVLGFGLVNGSSLARQFKGAILSVSVAQYEASLALGFSKFQTFMGIVAPQAIRVVLPGYFLELIGLMKGTSIVGYVAVMDLTKVGDVIRGSTYDAFFPLISVAVIYFLISFILLSILKLLQKKLAPKRETADDKKGADK